jgi:hypothetical protein
MIAREIDLHLKGVASQVAACTRRWMFAGGGAFEANPASAQAQAVKLKQVKGAQGE